MKRIWLFAFVAVFLFLRQGCVQEGAVLPDTFKTIPNPEIIGADFVGVISLWWDGDSLMADISVAADGADHNELWQYVREGMEVPMESPPSLTVTEEDVFKAFEESYLMSATISLVTMGDGTQTPPNRETLEDYRVISAEKVDHVDNPNIWFVTFDVKPKHNADADFDPMRGPYMYGWVAGNGELTGDWVLGKMLFVSAVKTDGVVTLEVLGTGL